MAKSAHVDCRYASVMIRDTPTKPLVKHPVLVFTGEILEHLFRIDGKSISMRIKQIYHVHGLRWSNGSLKVVCSNTLYSLSPREGVLARQDIESLIRGILADHLREEFT